MSIESIDDGIKSIQNLWNSEAESFNFRQAAMKLSEVVGLYSASVDKLYDEAFQFQTNLSSRNFISSRSNKMMKPDKKTAAKIVADASNSFSLVKITHGRSLDLPPATINADKLRQQLVYHKCSRQRYNPVNFGYPEIGYYDIYVERNRLRYEKDKRDKYELALNDWAYTEEPIQVWIENEENCFQELLASYEEEQSKSEGLTSIENESLGCDEGRASISEEVPPQPSGESNRQEKEAKTSWDSIGTELEELTQPSVAVPNDIISEVGQSDETGAGPREDGGFEDSGLGTSLQDQSQPTATIEDDSGGLVACGSSISSEKSSSEKIKKRHLSKKRWKLLKAKRRAKLKKLKEKSRRSRISIMDLSAPIQRSKRLNPEPDGDKLLELRPTRKGNSEETGISITKYKNKIRGWFADKPVGTKIEFRKRLAGKRPREASRHFLALLHLVNEYEFEISSKSMDNVTVVNLNASLANP